MTLIDEKVELLRTREGLDRETLDLLSQIDEKVTVNYTLADAIREGSTVSGQAYNWSDEQGNLCALSAAVVAAKARGRL